MVHNQSICFLIWLFLYFHFAGHNCWCPRTLVWSWSASLFLFAVDVALLRIESPVLADVIRVRRSSNLYQYESNRSASFTPALSANVCVCVLIWCFFSLFAFYLWLSLLCAIYTASPKPPLYLSILTVAFAISHGRATPQFAPASPAPSTPPPPPPTSSSSSSSSSLPSSLKSLQWFFYINFCVSRAFRFWFVFASYQSYLSIQATQPTRPVPLNWRTTETHSICLGAT